MSFNKCIYLDNLATTKPDERVVSRIVDVLRMELGNPSSDHSVGRNASSIIEHSREAIADVLGVQPKELYFCGSATESNNIAIAGFCLANRSRGNHIVMGGIEHPSVSKTVQYLADTHNFEVTTLNVDGEGFVSVEELEKVIAQRKDTILVSVMLVNNEIGTVQDMDAIGEICRKYSVALHADMVQALGKIPISLENGPVDLATFSGHKIHGPRGIGLLYCRKGTKLQPLTFGGSQEGGIRAGTESPALIAGLAEAMGLISPSDAAHMRRLQIQIIEKLADLPDVRMNGPQDLLYRSPSNLSLAFAWRSGERLQRILDSAGIIVGTRAACTSAMGASETLKRIGTPIQYLHGTIRIGLSRNSTSAEVDTFCSTLRRVLKDSPSIIESSNFK
jgi:cysteine desulfurase